VINEDLPVIFERFGGKPRVWVDRSASTQNPTFYYITNGELEILLVDVSQEAGGVLYDVASEQFAIPPDRSGVPRLVVGDSVLVGSVEIPSILPGMIERARTEGGLDWPTIDGLRERIPVIPEPRLANAEDTVAGRTPRDSPPPARVQPDTPARARPEQAPPPPAAAAALDTAVTPVGTADTATADAPQAEDAAVQSSLEAIPAERDTVWTRFRRDPVGNGMAIVVLLLMVSSLWAVSSRASHWNARDTASIAVPALAVLGLGLAAYLTYVEMSGTLAVCGPVGDCNAVQQSPYARVAGIPVGLLGLAGYAAFLVAWGLSRTGPAGVGRWATLGLFAMAFVGVLFSVYLTFLEPFVIGATCIWCLTSAVIMTLLLWVVAGPGTVAWKRIRHG
jgi:uncharacterized membrane protein